MDNLSREINNYLNICKNLKGLSEFTLKAYTIDLMQFNDFVQKENYLSKEILSRYIDALHKQYKPKSAKRKIACVKAFYNYMEAEDLIEFNPFHKIRIKYKEPVVLPKTIPIENIKVLLKYAYHKNENSKTVYQKETTLRNIIIIELLFSTGMRVSEISNLKRKNIDLQSDTIYIYGKGSRERVMCIANKKISHLIEKYLKICKSNSNFAFTNKLGNKYSEQSIRNMINEYAEAAGVKLHITPHMFRHTFATALLDEDVDIRYIQQLLGHSSIVTTQIYTHTSTKKIRRILEDKHPRNGLNI